MLVPLRLSRAVAGIWRRWERLFYPGLPGQERRLLAIYDLSAQPFSIGDILVIQEASLALREKYGLGLVDFALVYDPQNPTCADPAFANINYENVLYHLASVLPAAQVNPYHGSLFVFNAHDHLQRFIADAADLYQVWHPEWHPGFQGYQYYRVFNEILYDYFRQHQRIPVLSCRPHLARWVRGFCEKHVYPDIPVTVQVRNNKSFHHHRNLNMDAWLEFFRHCEGCYPVKFIVVCSIAEVDPRLRELPNVVVAKDHMTSLEQDLALVQESAIHMGASSGPGILATFSDKPYLMVNTDLIPKLYRDTIYEGQFLRLYFASPLQRLSLGRESVELLDAEFARMWSGIDLPAWRAVASREEGAAAGALSWLR